MAYTDHNLFLCTKYYYGLVELISIELSFLQSVFVCSNTNPLHYYALWVPRKADRWRWVWSIFESRTAWTDVYLYSVLEEADVRVTVCVVLLWSVGWIWKKGRRWNPVPAHSLLFSKTPRGPPGLTSPSDGRVTINSTICLLNICTAEGFGI